MSTPTTSRTIENRYISTILENPLFKELEYIENSSNLKNLEYIIRILDSIYRFSYKYAEDSYLRDIIRELYSFRSGKELVLKIRFLEFYSYIKEIEFSEALDSKSSFLY